MILRGALVVVLASTACGRASRGVSEHSPALQTSGGTSLDAAAVSSPSSCAEREGGGLITFEENGEAFTVWSTNDAFIDKSLALYGAHQRMTPNFTRLAEGADCDRWPFHVDPQAMAYADLHIELCDGRPSDVARDPKTWISKVKTWCPWLPTITGIVDRRSGRRTFPTMDADTQ